MRREPWGGVEKRAGTSSRGGRGRWPVTAPGRTAVSARRQGPARRVRRGHPDQFSKRLCGNEQTRCKALTTVLQKMFAPNITKFSGKRGPSDTVTTQLHFSYGSKLIQVCIVRRHRWNLPGRTLEDWEDRKRRPLRKSRSSFPSHHSAALLFADRLPFCSRRRRTPPQGMNPDR